MHIFIELLSLGSARARIALFTLATVLVYLAPISLLAHLSIWKLIGIDAPSIGLTRAYHYVLHGDFAQAYHQNKIIYAVLIIGLPILLKDAYNMLIYFKQRIHHGRSQHSINTNR